MGSRNERNTVIEGIHYATNQPISLSFENGYIREMQSLFKQKDASLPYIAPGLVDLQINGFRGFDFNTLPLSQELVEQCTQVLWEEGVTFYYPTIITNSDEAIEEAVKTISQACENNKMVDECVAGIHVEGPFISPEDGPRGAHGKDFVKAPDWELFQRWQEAANGRIKIMTMSPEWPDSAQFISKCAESGVIVSIGHTAATPEQIQSAVAAGARMSTHLGNGAHLMLPRHPNYLWEQLAQDDLSTCLVADGFHLPESLLKVAISAKGSKSMIVSDAVYLSGLEPGEYDTHIGGKVELTPEGRLHMRDNPKLLAGSVKMLKDGITHLTRKGLSNLDEAWNMASIRPAKLTDLPAKQGLAKGAPADLVVFNWEGEKVNIEQTYKSGNVVYSTN